MVEKPDDHQGRPVTCSTGVAERKVIADIVDDFRDKIRNGGVPDIKAICEKLKLSLPHLNERDVALLLDTKDPEIMESLYGLARKQRESLFGRNVWS